MKLTTLALPLFAATLLASSGDALAAPKTMTRDAVIALAKSATNPPGGGHYSYWWGHGRWRNDGAQHGSCSGSCPSCSHSGGYGADCSGLIGKVWQVPSPIAVTTDGHPYSTYNYRFESQHWKSIARSSAKKADSFVYSSGGSGHIFLYEKGDPWGSVWAYECKGCSYGCIHDLRTVYSSYQARQRDLITDFPDKDSDGVADAKDNCPGTKNPGQMDTDKDGKGDLCDGDDDGDGVPDDTDNCPKVKNPGQADSGGDGKGDACVKDNDGDGVLDSDDVCPTEADPEQEDTDGNGVGDACDDAPILDDTNRRDGVAPGDVGDEGDPLSGEGVASEAEALDEAGCALRPESGRDATGLALIAAGALVAASGRRRKRTVRAR